MSLYGKKLTIDGVPCGLVMRANNSDLYDLVFEREFASIEDIEGINWAQPQLSGESVLPAGYGFQVEHIGYDAGTRSYTVTVRTGNQYLGDVVWHNNKIKELKADVADKAAEVQALEDQLAEADEALIAMYESQEAPTVQETQTGGEVSA